MADVTEVIKRLIVEAQTRGLDKAAADFEKFGATAKQAASTTENSLASTGRSFERLAGSIDPARKQLQLLAKDLATLESGRGKPGIADEYLNGLKEARTAQAAANIEILKTGQALGQQTAAMGQHAQAAKLSAYEMKNLGFQLNDAATMLLSGSSVFQVAATQGGQTLQVLQGGGGLVANIKDLGSRFLGLITPATAAFAAIATGAVAAAVGMSRLAEQTKEAQQALGGGRGRFLQASPQDLAAAAEQSRAPGVSLSESRAGILAGVRAGAPDLRTLQQANDLARRYATTVQSELIPAQKELADLVGDRTTKSYQALAEKLNLNSGSVVENIRQLQGQGKYAEAVSVALGELEKALVKNETATTAAGRAWAYFFTQIEKGLEVAGRGAAALALPMPGTGEQRAIAQQSALSRPGFDTAIRGETGRSSTRQADDARALAEELRAVAEATGQANAAMAKSAEEAAIRQDKIATSIRNATQAQQDQIAVMNAVTVAQRAAAVETQTYNQLIDKGVAVEEARAKAALASQMVLEQAAANSRQRVADQQIEIEINSRMISAYQQQGDGIESVVARLKEEQSIRQAGMDATSKENQARIENAGRIAEQTKALEKLKSAQQGAMATTYNPDAAGGYEMAGGGGTGSDRTSQYNSFLASLEKGGNTVRNFLDSMDSKRFIQLDNQAKRLGMSVEDAARYVMKFGNNLDQAANSVATIGDWASTSFAAGGDKPLSQRGGFTSSWFDPTMGNMEANIDRSIGKGVWKAMGYLGNIGAPTGGAKELQQKLIDDAQKSSHQIATQALQNTISIATRALSKQIQQIQETASDQLSALSDAAQEAGDALSKAADKRQKLEDTLKENEDKRQQRIQNYLAAGPSPFEKNADIFYDPKSRMAFAEQIAGNTDELLVAQLAAAKAQEDAAKDADKNAKAAVKAGEAAQKAAEEQVKQLQAQQDQLEQQAELLSAGLDIDTGIGNNVLALIGVIKNELPGAIGDHMSALMGITGAKAQTDISAVVKDAPLSARYTATGGATGAIVAGISPTPAIGGGGISLPGYGVGGTSLGIRRYARGGEFTVPGSYSAGDRPFVVGLAGQERVTVETPAQQAARSRGGGGSGTNIENLIVQMPPATNPIEYLNKRSRPALGRAVRSMARGAGAR